MRKLRIVLGTEQPGGVACLFPLIKRLRADHQSIEFKVVGGEQATLSFSKHGIACEVIPSETVERTTTLRNLLIDYHPDFIVTCIVGDIRSGIDYRLLKIGKELGIFTFSILDAWMNYSDRLLDPETKDYLSYAPTRISLMDDETIEEFRQESLPIDNVVAFGHPAIDEIKAMDSQAIRDKVRLNLNLKDSDKFVVFFSEPIREFYNGTAKSPGYDEFDAYELILEALSEFGPQMAFGVREHPRSKSLSHLFTTSKIPVRNLDAYDSFELLHAADVVLGMSTSLLVFGYLLGKEVHVIQPNLVHENNLCLLTKRGALGPVQSSCKLVKKLKAGIDRDKLHEFRSSMKWYTSPSELIIKNLYQQMEMTYANN